MPLKRMAKSWDQSRQQCLRAEGMQKMLRKMRWPSRFLRSENGNATIEAVLWIPVLTAAFALIADTSLIFGSESQVLRIVQDANREMSIGRLLTVAAVQAQVKSKISNISPNAIVTTTLVDGLISTQVSIPLSDITATGLVRAFTNVSVTVSAEHLSEG